jgi:hypothetical protein
MAEATQHASSVTIPTSYTLQIDEIDSFYASVLASRVEIAKTIRDEPWHMREFGLVTIDGHRIMFAAPK